jgi:O-antigen ligase/polysaccharide polymerase Wzy-like membrane protein/tetratricopeptide repeat protein
LEGAGRAAFDRWGPWWPTILIAAVLCWVAFLAKGGLNLAHLTAVEMTLTIGSSVIAAAAIVLAPSVRRGAGAWSFGLLLAFSALTALSAVWSVQPDSSWQDAGRLFAFAAVFGVSMVLARAAPGRWPAVLGGVTLAAVVVCGWALLTKVFPNHLDASDPYARLRAPYSYWNAIGLTAAMGAVGCLWLGSRRTGHALLSALAYPAMGLTLLTLLLAYSRGALAALALGLVLWFCIVPRRLRGATVLLTGGAGAAVVVAFAFSRHALSSDNVALAERTSAGHQLGALIVVMLIALALAGMLIGFLGGRRTLAPAARTRAGATLLSILALALLGGVGAVAASHRGLSGSVSHAFNSLTNPHAPVPPNTPGRLTAIASVRARYWNEALKVFQAHPALGSGAEGYATARLRYRTETLEVRHAHGYIVQTLADLGLVGLALTLALLFTWMAAAGRCTHPFNRRWSSWGTWASWRSGERPGWRRAPAPYTPERNALLSMLALVVVFGIHSLVDWTWYVPGDACVALLCAGWLAGRGELAAPQQQHSAGPSVRFTLPRVGEVRTHAPALAIAAAAVIAALLAAWAQWQPQRSVDASQRGLALLARDPRGAEASAHAGVSRDPLSAQALFTLATVEQASGNTASARATLLQAVRLQPSNPQTWLALGEFDLAHPGARGASEGGPHAAVSELAAAIYLNPELVAPESIARGSQEAITAQNDYVEALRASMPAPAPTRPATLTPAGSGLRAGAARRAARRARVRARGAAPRG